MALAEYDRKAFRGITSFELWYTFGIKMFKTYFSDFQFNKLYLKNTQVIPSVFQL